MSARPDPGSDLVPDALAVPRGARLSAVLGLFALALLAALAARVAGNGFQARVTLELADAVIGAGGGVELDFLNSLGRAVSIATVLLAEALPGASISVLPAVTVLAAAAFVGVFARLLDRRGWPAAQIALAVSALLLHPIFLKAATDGTTTMLSGLAFFVLIYVSERLEHVGDVQAQMNVGLALGAVILVDPGAIYVVLPLMAVLPLLYKEVRDARSAAAALLMVVMPPLTALAAFVYLHVAFSPQPLSRPFELWASPLHGSVGRIGAYDWLMRFGGDLAAPLALLTLGALVCVPAHLAVVWRLIAARAERNKPGAALAALIVPVVAGALATDQMHARSAWPFLLAALMAALVWIATKPIPDYVRRRAVLLLLLGSLASWFYPPIWAERGAAAWRAALVAEIAPPDAWRSTAGSWFDPRHVTEPLRGFEP